MNVGYIAMSGLQLVYAPLLDLGLSFPAVARRAKEIEALPSLGLLTIAGMTPEDVEVEYLEVRDVDHENLPLLESEHLGRLLATEASPRLSTLPGPAARLCVGARLASTGPKAGTRD